MVESSYRIDAVKDTDFFWKLGSVGISDDPQQNDDKKAWKHFQETVVKDKRRYVISWPWKKNRPKLADNFELCIGRLRFLWNKLVKDKNLLNQYNDIIKD